MKKSGFAFLVLIVLFGVQAFLFNTLSIHDGLPCEINKFSSEAVFSPSQKSKISANHNADVLYSLNTFSFLSKEKMDEQHFATVFPIFSHHLFKWNAFNVEVLFSSFFPFILDCLYPYFFFF